jgi:hypothetical protein
LRQLTILVLFLVSVAACVNQDRAGAAQKVQETKGVAAESVSPETLVSFQRRVVRVIPLAGSQTPAKVVADQWVFRFRGDDDDTLICVDDESHCIGLKQLHTQLYRPVKNPFR